MITSELRTGLPSRTALEEHAASALARRRPLRRHLRPLVAVALLAGLAVVLLRNALPWWTYRQTHVITSQALVVAPLTEVGARIDGQVVAFEASPGARVRQGDVLARLADSHLRLRHEQRKVEEQLAVQERAVAALSIDQATHRLEAALGAARIQGDLAKAGLAKSESDFNGSQSGLARAKSELSKAQSGLAKARSELARWDSEALRLRELHVSGNVSERDLDRALTERASAEAECASATADCESGAAECAAATAGCESANAVIQAARAHVEAASLGVRRAELDLEALVVSRAELGLLDARIEMARAAVLVAAAELEAAQVRAPQDGLVLEWIVGPGGSVRVGQPIVRLQLDAGLRIHAWVEQTEMGTISVGDAADVVLDAYPDLPLQGSVESILAQPAFDQLGEPEHPSRSSLLPAVSKACVAIRVNGSQTTLHPGMSARVSLARLAKSP